MYPYLTPRQFAWAAAIGFGVLIVAVALIQSRRSEDAAVLTPLGHGEAALVSEIARCRTITPDDGAVLDTCRRIWAENRQRFFASTKSPQPSVALSSDAPAVPMKSQDGVLPHGVEQGWTR
ncbi:putative entry exclusion protein TrbK-alt [Bradyrhizobium manausense]|jgi:conjugative transfer region protein TrbK|uniref:putative entry exclusion protein TrbK-alt n=1 Tax=Bradyrhizobium manausense TaxID=989370 RepID=UPI001BAA6025|nr:putative entry exclusion protein TrbK-alt [Bradyrhizobium manausense]MBR1087835.1 putative entry exclusion protein TrbK-alt [Bradyrhizobium manausense]